MSRRPDQNHDPRLPVRVPGTRAVRPREAATLIIYRRQGDALDVLMGERHRKHRFMPHRYVFPGGGVDPSDSRIRLAKPLCDDVRTQLERRLSSGRARAMAVAAVRETFEETGLIMGAPDPKPGARPPTGWEQFFDTGLAPALDRLEYVARAVTPAYRPVRFNARFFMVDSRHVQGDLSGSGELVGLRWFAIRDAQQLEMPMITHKVLEHIEELFQAPPRRAPNRPIPYFKHMGTYHKRIDE